MPFKFITTSLALACTCTWAMACDNSESSASLQSKLAVVDSTFHINQESDPTTIATIGTIKNPTGACANDIVVEAKYFDAGGTLIDVQAESLLGFVVPARQEVAFRVRGPADQPKEAYAKVVVRVASVSPQYVPVPVEERSKLVELLYLWGPGFVLLGLIALMTRHQWSKNSAQQKMLFAIEQQTAMLERKIAVLERMLRG